jgi:hypothetical protein
MNKGRQQSLMYPFVASKSMSEMMDFVRKPGWRPQVNLELIKKLGIATNNEGKVLSALRFLDLIDETGHPTSSFDELKKEYAPTFKRLTREKYRDLFSIIPIEMITRARLESYFGRPAQGAERRARFFIWLCGEAGITLPGVADDHE